MIARARGRLGRTRGGWTALVLVALAIVLVGGKMAGGTFASYFSGETTYQGSTFGSGSLTAPTALTATPSGSSVNLSWAVGTHGNQQDLNGVDTTSSSSCSSANSFSPLTVVSSSATSATDTNQGGQSGIQAGDNYCYKVATAYGQSTVTLKTALTSGQTGVTSLALSSLPAGVLSGDSIELTNPTGSSQIFTASSAHAASASQVSLAVTSATSNAAFSTSSTAADVTSWTSWTSNGAYANARVGFAVTGVTIANGGTSATIDNSDTVSITFNQLWKTTPTTTAVVCAFASPTNTVLLGDTTAHGGTACGAGDTYTFGKLVSSVALTTAAKYTGVAYSSTGNTLTLTISGAPTSKTTVGSSPTWTFTPASSFASNTGSVAVCTSNAHSASLCQPTTTTNF